MHTDQSRWLEGQARGQQGGCGATPGPWDAGGGQGRQVPGPWGPQSGVQPPLASPPAPLASGMAPQPSCCPLAWPSSNLDWSV